MCQRRSSLESDSVHRGKLRDDGSNTQSAAGPLKSSRDLKVQECVRQGCGNKVLSVQRDKDTQQRSKHDVAISG